MKIEEGKYYRTRSGRRVGPMQTYNKAWERTGETAFIEEFGDGRLWDITGLGHRGAIKEPLVAEWVEPEDAQAQAAVESIASDDAFHARLADGTPIPPRATYSVGPLTAEGYEKLSAALKNSGPGEIRPLDVEDDGFRTVVPDVKAAIADEAKNIVSGARRNAYGKPEDNFERIARFWQGYFENTGRADAKITAADVSPLMRLMKEARLCETPNHRDSFVDLVGYTLTGAEVNGVSATKAGA